MPKYLFASVLFLCCFFPQAQTGPAGVESSATNVFWIKANKGTSTSVNGAAMSAWNDQSGNGINMSQSVSAQQPLFSTSIMNGLPAVQFDNSNTPNTNDKMIGPDSPILDNTRGYTFFTVTRPQYLNTDARVIVSKRTTVSVDQSFMLFYYSANKFFVDIQTTDNRFNSSTVFSSNNNYIIDMVYDGTLSSGSRSKLYLGESLDITATESATLVPDNNSPIILGTTDATDPRPFGGYISEVIIYRTALVPAQRTIVNNYLSAKYDIALSANDKYAGDTPVNGDYDKEVAGIGQESTGSNTAFLPSISGGIGIEATSGLDNTDYVMAGHAMDNNAPITTDVGGMTGPNNARWERIWYIDVTNTSTAIDADIHFSAIDGGTGVAPLGTTVSDYVLLYRAGQTGNWTELATATSVVGDKAFFNVSLTNDGYYTLGSKNYINSVLPIELISFDAKLSDNKVDLKWLTATEKNNALFTVEKTKDGEVYETVEHVEGAGNSLSVKDYSAEDVNPFDGLSYYRLKQTDVSGSFTYSSLIGIYYNKEIDDLIIFPNPNEGIINIKSVAFVNSKLKIQINDATGRTCYTKTLNSDKNLVSIEPENKLSKGNYLLLITAGDRTFVRKLLVK